jgi:hypothetical protein
LTWLGELLAGFVRALLRRPKPPVLPEPLPPSHRAKIHDLAEERRRQLKAAGR